MTNLEWPLLAVPGPPARKMQDMAMREGGVSFDGRGYRYGDDRDDRLADAVDYARTAR